MHLRPILHAIGNGENKGEIENFAFLAAGDSYARGAV
jgi:hypothetical protein